MRVLPCLVVGVVFLRRGFRYLNGRVVGLAFGGVGGFALLSSVGVCRVVLIAVGVLLNISQVSAETVDDGDRVVTRTKGRTAS